MKVIFLDFDGVLNNSKYLLQDKDISLWDSELDPKNVSLLNDFLKDSDYKIIISSSWARNLCLDQLKFLFLSYNDILTRIVDKVDNLNYLKPEAIKIFIKKNKLSLEDFVIIDDNILYSLESPLNRRQIKTSMGTGITEKDIESIKKLLK